MLKKSVLVLLAVLAIQSQVHAQSRIDVQDAAVNAIVAMGEFAEARSQLSEVLTASRQRIATVREMIEAMTNAESRETLQSVLDAIVARVAATTTQYEANRIRYWNTGMTEYNEGCISEALDHRPAAIRFFNDAEALFKSGKAEAEALLLDANDDLNALNALMCHKLFYASFD